MANKKSTARFPVITLGMILLSGCGSLILPSDAETRCTSNPGSTITAPVKSDANGDNKPDYPALSKRRNEQGRVVIGVLIDPSGKVAHAEIQKSSGYPLLDNSAFDFAARSKFLPGSCNGIPVTMTHEVPVIFFMD